MKKYVADPSTDIDPMQFHDPVALTTQWNSMLGMSASYTSHILVDKEPDIMVYNPTRKHLIFCFGYSGFSAVLLFLMIFCAHSLFGAIVCGLFLVVGIFLIRDGSGPITFDKKRGIFYKGWRMKKQNKKAFARIGEVYAVQLLENRTGAELNLVFKDGSRIHVIAQSSKRQLSIDGDLISGFLGIPVWDAIPKKIEMF
ncbi:hypothetical protein [Macellibacteroides fermentans]|uniref:hypothetical protein n=1 Tax=Macellibacteroides fermentans TaxID=879969 RepID=UPI00406C68BB